MFEVLFKYPASYFEQGQLLLAVPGWQFALMPLVVFVLVFIALGYFHLRHRAALRDRLAVTLMRSLALSLLIFSLSRPLLEVDTLMPQPNLVALLLDNSVSMTLPDASGAARGDLLRRQLDPDGGELLRDLRASYDTRMFEYGAQVKAVDSAAGLDFADGASNLAQALGFARESLRGEPLAGLVVFSDGASSWSAELEKLLLELRAEGIPVHTVGFGPTRYARDVALRELKLPSQLLHGSRVTAELTLTQQGYDGREVELLVEDDSRILHQQTLRLQGARQVVELPLVIEDSGARLLRFALAPQPDEIVTANNERFAMPSVVSRKPRILHFEGEPRFELKFIRRALAADESLRLTGLIRTADAKFYRVGVESEDELINGFPLTRDELFAYDGLIIGSVEASLLSRAQQQMIVDFVSERGGGLLLLGGRQAFAEGGYRDSVLRDILPVVLADEARSDFSRQVRVEPTASAWVHPALMLDPEREKSMVRWRSLPPLTVVNPIRQIKPGADLLLTGSAAAEEDPLVVMAAQRFGRGKVLAFAVQNSWLWQMHHEIDLEDQSHELLWRQLLRWLVEAAPQRLSLTQSATSTHVGGTIEVRSEALGADFEALPQADLRAVVTLPDGGERYTVLKADAGGEGIYAAEIAADAPGDYELRVELDSGEEKLSSRATRIRVSAAGSEFHDSELNTALLQQIADTSAGRYFDAADSGGLLAALDSDQRQSRALSRLELWDMPILFALLVLLLSAEWGYRRWRNLV